MKRMMKMSTAAKKSKVDGVDGELVSKKKTRSKTKGAAKENASEEAPGPAEEAPANLDEEERVEESHDKQCEQKRKRKTAAKSKASPKPKAYPKEKAKAKMAPTKKKADTAEKPKRTRNVRKDVPVDESVKDLVAKTLLECTSSKCTHPSYQKIKHQAVDLEPYNSRKACGVKVERRFFQNHKAKGKGKAHVTYFSGSTPCHYTNMVLGQLWVSRLHASFLLNFSAMLQSSRFLCKQGPSIDHCFDLLK